jgi:hypothetical protein
MRLTLFAPPTQDFLPKFVLALPNAAFRWIEDCGHSPHLEQPAILADALAAFLRGEVVAGDSDVSDVVAFANRTPMQVG